MLFWHLSSSRELPSMKTIIIVASALAGALVTVAWLHTPKDPKTYDECVLQHVKPGMTKDASAAVCSACRGSFPLDPSAVDPNEHDHRLVSAALRFALKANKAGYVEGGAVAQEIMAEMLHESTHD